VFLLKPRPSRSYWCYWWPNPRSWSDRRFTCRRLFDAQVSKSVLGVSLCKKGKKVYEKKIPLLCLVPMLIGPPLEVHIISH